MLGSPLLNLQVSEARIQILRFNYYALLLELGKNEDPHVSNCNCPFPCFV